MSDELVNHTGYRFGDFKVHITTAELWLDGTKVKVQELPFQVLVALLERPGELVTREELQKRLWSGDVFVDFDTGINVAVRKLRTALNDTSERPRYIETMPRRGYRFIAPVEGLNGNGSSLHSEPISSLPAGGDISVDSAQHRGETNKPESMTPDFQESKPKRHKSHWWKPALAIAAIVIVAGSLYSWLEPRINQLIRLYQLQQLAVVPLTTLPGNVWSPTFSPDGRQVAFIWDGGDTSDGKGDVYIKVIGRDELLRVTHSRGTDSVAWSPDGRNMALWRVAGPEGSGVFLMSPLGGPERKIASTESSAWFGDEITWSSDGKRLAFVEHPADSPSHDTVRLFVLSLDSMEKALVDRDCQLVQTPAFSPRGDYLAWACLDTKTSVSIHLQRLTDGRITVLLRNLDVWLAGLTWSSDGRRILFTNFGTGDLWEVPLARPNHAQKLPVVHDASDIAVSSAGERFAFTQDRVNINIWRLNLSKEDAQIEKVVASSRAQFDPEFSPDGNRITFTSNRSGSYEIWVSDSTGSNATQLSSFGNRFTGSPHWSPNGKLIAFDSRVGGEANIYFVDPNGGAPRKLDVGLRGGNSFPTWSHDGNWIYFVNADDGHHAQIWKIPPKGGQAIRVAKDEALFPRESLDGRYVYFCRNRHLWQVRTDGSEEQQVQAMPRLAAQGEAWTIFGTGIYVWCYLDGKQQIVFFDLNTQNIRHVLTTEKPPGGGAGWIGGITVSRDGKWLLFPEADELSRNLVLVENWR